MYDQRDTELNTPRRIIQSAELRYFIAPIKIHNKKKSQFEHFAVLSTDKLRTEIRLNLMILVYYDVILCQVSTYMHHMYIYVTPY